MKSKEEQAELHKAIWNIADSLRGSVSGWEFKAYVLGALFYRFISEKLENRVNADEARAGNVGFVYGDLSDKEPTSEKEKEEWKQKWDGIREAIVQKLGFFISPSHLFPRLRHRTQAHGRYPPVGRNSKRPRKDGAWTYAAKENR